MKKNIEILRKRALEEIKPDQDLLVLTIAGSILASFGLILNNVYILIGAMLVAPYFDPIISFVIFLLSFDLRNFIRSFAVLSVLILLTVIVSTLCFYIIYYFEQYEPNYIITSISWEYFIVAVVLGIVGTLLWKWPKTSNTSAGLSVSISLVPPLAQIGEGIVNESSTYLKTSLVVFFINLIGLVIGSALVFAYQKNRPEKKLNV